MHLFFSQQNEIPKLRKEAFFEGSRHIAQQKV